MKNPIPKKLLLSVIFIFFTCHVFGQQSLQNQIRSVSQQGKSFQKLGKTILDVSSLKKLYELRDFQPIWFQNNKLNSMGQSLLAVLNDPVEFGFEKSEWVDKELENITSKINNEVLNDAAILWYDLFLSDLAIKFSKALYQGRVLEPELIDDDTKFKKKNFEKYELLNQTLSGNPNELKGQLTLMEPKNGVYVKLKQALGELLSAEKNYTWKNVEVAEEFRKKGSKSSQIRDLKKQMLFYGFKFNGDDLLSDEYDDELELAIEQYHSLYKTGAKGITVGLLKSMNNTLEYRKKQLNLALEKARWLPDELEPNHIFINLAFQEFKLYESNQLVMEMKTINGQKFRRTPLMKDIVTVVELNPTWTVPYNIAVKDKLPKLKNNPEYLSQHNMKLIDNITKEEIDPYAVNWAEIERSDFKYTIVQGSGPDNALGLVKFPLTNPWSIYMHDTNERGLFAKPQRLLSSGCVRLERPFDFANYLLRDNANYPPEKIKQVVDDGLANQQNLTPTRIKVKKGIPVYTLFLTVDKSKEGILRFADDYYGSDHRLRSILQSTYASELKEPEAYIEEQSLTEQEGAIVFNGKLGEQQFSKWVKLYKCIPNKKNSCEFQGSLELNKAYKVPAGYYLAIHDTSMTPEFIKIEAYQLKKMEMINIQTPDVFTGESELKLYKDVSHPLEQNKILKEAFYFKTSPFAYSQYGVNDFYVTSARMKSINQRYEYSQCVSAYNSLSEEARSLCDSYRSASSENDLEELFSFNPLSSFDKLTSGQYYQMWITKPGDRVKVLQKRILVSAPYAAVESVLVFPGMYRLISEKSNQMATIKAF